MVVGLVSLAESAPERDREAGIRPDELVSVGVVPGRPLPSTPDS